jgi:hypothetical protein
MHEHKTRQRWRRKAVAEHFGVNIRTVDLWVKRGVIKPPLYLPGSPIPFWFVDELPGIVADDNTNNEAA